MKLLNPSFMLAFGAALVSVEAVPLRLLVVTNNQELADNIRFGHAVPNPMMNSGVRPYRIAAGPDAHKYRPCFIRKMHHKAIQISNAFRTALGLPPIELPGLDSHPAFGIFPVGTPITSVEVKGPSREVITEGIVRIAGPEGLDGPDYHVDHPHHHHGHHGHHKHHGFMFCRKSPFIKRLSFALMALGPWEGRIVAFVLGCGLGVLLRMLWVLSLITFRAIRGRRAEQTEYHVIHEYEDLSAPPTYAYVDEKVDAKKDLEETRT